jgi:hypothetical protein
MKIVNSLRLTAEKSFKLPIIKMEVTIMNKKNKPLISEEQLTITANLNNLEPGDSVNEHRNMEAGNIILAEKEIGQQNNNL